jgi:hypothetical protein
MFSKSFGAIAMKRIVISLVATAACTLTASTFAQQGSTSNTDPSRDTPTAQGDTANAPGYGGAVNGGQQGEAGHHVFNHLRRDGSSMSPGGNCVGPVSYCNIFFGS